MSVTLTIDGLDKFFRITDSVRATRELDTAVNRSAEVLRDETKKMPPVSMDRTGFGAKGIPVAPVQGGTLRQSIQKRKLGLMAAEVYVGANYGGYVHQGTPLMPARPFFRWQLEDFGGKDKIQIILTAALGRIASP